jgi:hypothetical protein
MRQGIPVRLSAVFVTATFVACLFSDDAFAARRARGGSIDQGQGWSVDAFLALNPPPQPDADDLKPLCIDDAAAAGDCLADINFKMNVGGVFFKRLWIDENGFVTLGTATDTRVPFVPTRSEVASFAPADDVVAIFHSDLFSKPNVACGANTNEDCDVSYSVYTPNGNPAPFIKGAKVSWGVYGNNGDTGNEEGVERGDEDPLDPTKRNVLQLRFLVRDGFADGDFDIEFNYGRANDELGSIAWEHAPSPAGRTLIGFKLGPYTLDLGKYYTSYVGEDPTDCELPELPANPTGGWFSPDEKFICNQVVVRFTGGVPELLGYTAGLTLDAPDSPAQAFSGETQSLIWTVHNAGPDPATGVMLDVEIPAGVTVATTPATNCTRNATNIRCPIGDIAANASASVTVPVRSTETGVMQARGTATASQFDPTGNTGSVDVDLQANADVGIDSCTAPASVVQGNPATVSCVVSNAGPQSATNVRLTLTLPSMVRFASSATCSLSGASVVCDVANLAVGATMSFSAELNTTASGTGNVTGAVSSGLPIAVQGMISAPRPLPYRRNPRPRPRPRPRLPPVEAEGWIG